MSDDTQLDLLGMFSVEPAEPTPEHPPKVELGDAANPGSEGERGASLGESAAEPSGAQDPAGHVDESGGVADAGEPVAEDAVASVGAADADASGDAEDADASVGAEDADALVGAEDADASVGAEDAEASISDGTSGASVNEAAIIASAVAPSSEGGAEAAPADADVDAPVDSPAADAPGDDADATVGQSATTFGVVGASVTEEAEADDVVPPGALSSVSHPLRVGWLPGNEAGRMGLVYAPGRRDVSRYTGARWHRDLAADLARLQGLGVDVVVNLMPRVEQEAIGVPGWMQQAQALGLEVLDLPIADEGAPEDEALLDERVAEVLRRLEEGEQVVLVSRGGQGRPGTVAGCIWLAQGKAMPEVLATLREERGPHCPHDAGLRFLQRRAGVATPVPDAADHRGSDSGSLFEQSPTSQPAESPGTPSAFEEPLPDAPDDSVFEEPLPEGVFGDASEAPLWDEPMPEHEFAAPLGPEDGDGPALETLGELALEVQGATPEAAAADPDEVAADADEAVAADADESAADADEVAADAVPDVDEVAADADEVVAADAMKSTDEAAADSDEVAADAEEVAADADEAAPDVDEVAADADEVVAADADESPADVDEVAADADEVAADSDESPADVDEVAADADEVAADADKAAALAVSEDAEVGEVAGPVAASAPAQDPVVLPAEADEVAASADDEFEVPPALVEALRAEPRWFGGGWSLWEERVAGAVLGAAIGDALGHPTEFIESFDAIRAQWPPAGVRGYALHWEPVEGDAFAPYTDDTQLAELLLRSVLAAPMDLNAAMEHFAEGLCRWADAPQGGHRAPGNACLAGAEAIAAGQDWRCSGGADAGGCGSVMRAYPIGLRFAAEPLQAERWAVAQSCLTHRDPIALAACAAMAVGVAHLSRGMDLHDALSEMVAAACRYDPGVAGMMCRALQEADSGIAPEVTLDRLRGWAAHEAIAAAVYILRRELDPAEALLEAANTPGDSDSIATLVGALLGAQHGARIWPAAWVRDLERSEELLALSREFAELG